MGAEASSAGSRGALPWDPGVCAAGGRQDQFAAAPLLSCQPGPPGTGVCVCEGMPLLPPQGFGEAGAGWA